MARRAPGLRTRRRALPHQRRSPRGLGRGGGARRARLDDAEPRDAAQDRAPNRTGRGVVARLLDADEAHTKSVFERRFLRFVRANGLPRPDRVNASVAGLKADCVYAEQRLVVELDGRAWHERRGQARRDHLRDERHQAAGHRIMRLVWDDLHPAEAATTAARLARMLSP